MVVLLLAVAAFEFDLPATCQPALLAGVACPSAGNAASLNPALLGLQERSCVGLNHTRPYAVAALQYNTLAAAAAPWQAGLRFSLLSFAGYQEVTASVLKSFSLLPGHGPESRVLSLGIRFDAYLLSVSGLLPTEFTPGLTAGLAYRDRSFTAGLVARNLNAAALGSGDRVPTALALGATVKPVPDLNLAADWEYEAGNASLRLASSFELNQFISLAAGIGTGPLQYSGGITCCYRGLSFGYAYRFNPRLKETQVIALGYTF